MRRGCVVYGMSRWLWSSAASSRFAGVYASKWLIPIPNPQSLILIPKPCLLYLSATRVHAHARALEQSGDADTLPDEGGDNEINGTGMLGADR